MIGDVAQRYDELAPKLGSIVFRDVNAPAAVIEDACQFAWHRLLRHAHHIDPQGALSWLAKTAVREAIRLARRDARELSLEARLGETGELNFPDPRPGPFEQVESRERLQLVGKLPLRQQRVLWQRALGFSYEEIALEHGVTVRAVERQLQRGRSRLRAAA